MVIVILQLNKHGLLPMIKVRAQSPTCLCLKDSGTYSHTGSK